MYTNFEIFNDLQLRPCFVIIGHSKKEILAHILSSEKDDVKFLFVVPNLRHTFYNLVCILQIMPSKESLTRNSLMD